MSDITAFPRGHVTEADDGTLLVHFDPGMTLRDYFAAKALAGYWADAGPDLSPEGAAITAQQCYQMADAMLKAREAK